MERPTKRARVSSDPNEAETDANRPCVATTPLVSLRRSITPPPRPRSQLSRDSASVCPEQSNDSLLEKRQEDAPIAPESSRSKPQLIPSPIQLTHIRDFPAHKGYNVDTVRLRDILGDPMVRECWQFNYLFDVDFLMAQFDEDVRSIVQVKVVHGSWEKESANRLRIDEACARHPNVESIVAYMPERFGTHHAKMMILLRHDDLAQVVIHTANMIYGDWANMTQAVWRSPLLPLQNPGTHSTSQPHSAIGSGARFKRDLLAYLKAYGARKTGALVQQLNKYDFGAIRAALVASVPSRQRVSELDSDKSTLWGWPALKDVMSRVPVRQQTKATQSNASGKSHIVTQISSIASLGQTDKWLKEIFFKALAPTPSNAPPQFSIIFPTSDEIRRSLEGYASGGSIHMKTQSAPQQKQLQYMLPHLCKWAGDSASDSSCIDLTEDTPPKREAGRGRAAPHIKTYIRYSDAATMDSIDWAMTTSANLSTQAWGAAPNPGGEVRISSWEIGVVVWPELFIIDDFSSSRNSPEGRVSGPQAAIMVPCFQNDQPRLIAEDDAVSAVVGFRMPYDLPLTPYSGSDEPWCATAAHHLPDWRGQSWIV
ncbi:hypothetical protein NUU61_002951 [Penicillium alfredii]|uniref:Tyrosyl-DNA phosphodiesterase n=1 Tax=Penicillium alfredii TaxID=1506179 RepID=A0A9W9FSN6_9EURO|nr:uncharacterized protein NUU61_002951 [Penicillium alfredii]KAJ5105604.1 hypothetical protein NUU61_002951 [Penicillium alfredii]